MERSNASKRWWQDSIRLGLGIVLAVGCAYPDYTYVDEDAYGGAAGKGGTAGTAGTDTGGAGGVSGQGAGGATGGTGGEDAGDGGDADVVEDVVEDIQEEDTKQDVFPDVVPDVFPDVVPDVFPDVVPDVFPDVVPDVIVDVVSEDSGQCVPVAENCSNGKDDDCDGLVDCEDPDCQALGFTCLNVPPTGWDGYYALFDGPTGAAPPLCTSQFPIAGMHHTGLQAASAQCSGCSCSSPMNMGCTVPEGNFFEGAHCTEGYWDVSFGAPFPSGNCIEATFQGGGAPHSLDYTPSIHDSMNPGFCSPSTVDIAISDPSWDTTAIHCKAESIGAGCGSPYLGCVSKPGSSFNGGLCIHREGTLSCPAPFTNRHIYYEGFNDGRSCTSCSCSQPTGVQCGSTVAIGVTEGCVNPEVVLSSPSYCTDGLSPNEVQYIKVTKNAASGGSCSASGGQPTGSVQPSKPHTFCCWMPN